MTAKPAPDEIVWWSGLRWVEAAHMQIRRFEEAFYEEVRALADAEMRHGLGDDSENSRSWRESYDAQEPYDPQRPLRVPSWSLHMQVANELDLLSVAIRNVLRAQERIPEEQRPAMGGQDALELLRNVAEHWDEVGGRSARELAEGHAGIEGRRDRLHRQGALDRRSGRCAALANHSLAGAGLARAGSVSRGRWHGGPR